MQSPTIVLDVGSHTVRAGLGGHDTPLSINLNLVGRPPSNSPTIMNYIGDESLCKRGHLNFYEPVVRGKVVLWEDWQRVLGHTFRDELRCAPEQHPLLLAVPPQVTMEDQCEMMHILFETYQVPRLCLENSAVCALVASGRADGLVLDAGHGKTHAVPIVGGVAVDGATLSLELGGVDLTRYLVDRVNQKGCGIFGRKAEIQIQEMKENFGRVSMDVAREISHGIKPVEYELMDGSVVTVEEEQIMCAEPLFNPQLLNVDQVGVHELIHESIRKCELQFRKQLHENIVLVGGSSLFKGFNERVRSELEQLVPSSIHIQIAPTTVDTNRKHSTWMGASLCSQMEEKKHQFVTLQQYEENGPHRKMTM